jgi:hypothetical protein
MAFGTGAVKITPAHDPNDYSVGMRHKLEFVNILNDDGTLNANAGPEFKGMKRFHARVEVVKRLKEQGLFVEVKDNPMQIPLCACVTLPDLYMGNLLREEQEIWGYHRANPEASMVDKLPAPRGEGFAAYARGRASHPAQDVRKRVVSLVGRPPGLVYLASTLVGSSMPGVLCTH